MKPKPITITRYVVASFEERRPPHYLCRDSKHGHFVVTRDLQRAMMFEDENTARFAVGEFVVKMGARIEGEWLAYRMTTKATFEPI